jgi:hypothetical protein
MLEELPGAQQLADDDVHLLRRFPLRRVGVDDVDDVADVVAPGQVFDQPHEPG